MNQIIRSHTIIRSVYAVLAALIFWALPGRAVEPGRWLLIFDTASAMKKRLPATEAELMKIFKTSLDGYLKSGDEVAVWTFDQQAHSGQFPLTIWQPADAPVLYTNLITFLRKQKYSGETSFAALQPTLGRVIENSQRLTVIIFCDGQSEINWTPYNDGINQTLKQNYAERKKANQPIVLLFRTQEGKFTACTVNFPPGGINLPAFPLLPEEIKALEPKPPTNPPVAPKSIAPPTPAPALIIVGKSVSTNAAQTSAAADDTNAPAPVVTNETAPGMSNSPAVATSVPSTAKVVTAPAHPTSPVLVTNHPEVTIAATTNLVAAETKTEADPRYRLLVWLATGALFLAGTLVILLVVRERRPRGSLITDSMNSPRNPPRKK